MGPVFFGVFLFVFFFKKLLFEEQFLSFRTALHSEGRQKENDGAASLKVYP